MVTTNTQYSPDIREVINLFTPEAGIELTHNFCAENGMYKNVVTVGGRVFEYADNAPLCRNELERKRYQKRSIKLCVYRALETFFGRSEPWGALTGIRPTKLAYGELAEGRPFEKLFKEMRVSDAKTELTARIIAAQQGIYTDRGDMTDFFVFVPFCPSKCKYCSFITADITKNGRYTEDYISALICEIAAAKPLIKQLRSVYIGGGTPICLPPERLEQVLEAVGKPNTEYTVEAGRPDVITAENTALLKQYGVTRVCVNPQTFNDATLERLGRKHTAQDIYDKYKLVKDKFVVNMDLIAGLEGESFADFKYSLDSAAALRPDNITVHTLCLKKGSELKERTQYLGEGGVSRMVEYAHEKLLKDGYRPYYLYRQKYMAGNLENTGYALPGKECVYNINVMEEISDNVACGAGAISKAVTDRCRRIERYKNPKDIATYIAKVGEIIQAKNKLFISTGEWANANRE